MHVSEIMTTDLLTMTKDVTVAEALRAADARDVHHILVTEGDGLDGVVCVCDLREVPCTDSLGQHVRTRPKSIPPQRTLDEAAEEFVQRGVSCFPVCDEGQLVGVITRNDLRRAAPDATPFPTAFACTFCGSTRHVRPLRGEPALVACLDCTDRAAPADSGLYDEGTRD